jgi:hypothetical protein
MDTWMHSNQPMYELLRACARFEPGGDAVARMRASAQDIDWDGLFEQAQHHGLIPLVYRNLSRWCPDSLPPHLHSRLLQTYFANAGHNLQLTGELLRILNLLSEAGIEAVPFKGPVLADQLFGNVSFRQFGDLDILVQQKDVRRARKLLISDGYEPEYPLEGRLKEEYIRSEHAFQLQKKDCGFVIELHWRFGSRNQVFPMDPAVVWTRLEPYSFQGREIRVLSWEDLLLYLCVHGAKHGWDRLEWITCVSELLRAPREIKWEVLLQRAANSGASRALHLGLLLASDLQPFAFPPIVMEPLSVDSVARTLADQVNHRLFVEELDHSRREIYRHTFYLRARERWSDRARILLYFSARVPHPLAKDWNLFRLPASLSFLYYLLRPMRLAREYGLSRLRAMLRPDTSF